MARWRVGLVAIVGVWLAAAASACGGGSGGDVSLSWQGVDGEQIQLEAASGAGAPLYRTSVLIRNESNSTLRGAKLLFAGALGARNAPAGFSVGTVAPISSSFEGDAQTWAVGDLPPGAQLEVPLGLWFDVAINWTQSHPVELTLSLVSADLDAPVVSNPLKVSLAR